MVGTGEGLDVAIGGTLTRPRTRLREDGGHLCQHHSPLILFRTGPEDKTVSHLTWDEGRQLRSCFLFSSPIPVLPFLHWVRNFDFRDGVGPDPLLEVTHGHQEPREGITVSRDGQYLPSPLQSGPYSQSRGKEEVSSPHLRCLIRSRSPTVGRGRIHAPQSLVCHLSVHLKNGTPQSKMNNHLTRNSETTHYPLNHSFRVILYDLLGEHPPEILYSDDPCPVLVTRLLV